MSNLRGNLQSIALTDVVQLLNVNRKSGKLYVINGKRTGTLYFQNGEVVHAETPDTAGESAAFDVLEWDKGEFEFAPSKFKVPISIKRSVPDLLMEGARTSDSRKRLRGVFPNLRQIPWPSVREPQLSQGIKLHPEDRKVLPHIDGYRDFMEVMQSSNLSEVSVLQTCLMLKEAGRLQVLEPSLTVSVGAMRMGFFKKSDHVELAKNVENIWKTMGPYRQEPIRNVRLLWPDGPAVIPVNFVTGLNEHVIHVPKELMQSWRLPEGILVSVRPAP